MKGKGAEMKKSCPLFLFPLPLPFSLFPIPLKTAATQSNDLQQPSDFRVPIGLELLLLLMTVHSIETKGSALLCLLSTILQDIVKKQIDK